MRKSHRGLKSKLADQGECEFDTNVSGRRRNEEFTVRDLEAVGLWAGVGRGFPDRPCSLSRSWIVARAFAGTEDRANGGSRVVS